MRTVELVGGPENGRRLDVREDVQTIRVPFALQRPAADYLPPNLAYDVTEYRNSGGEYRWEGMIGDAYATMVVADQAWTEGGPDIRAGVREMLRNRLRGLDPLSEVDRRAIWRVRCRPMFGLEVTARVGPHRVGLGLAARDRRRSGDDG